MYFWCESEWIFIELRIWSIRTSPYIWHSMAYRAFSWRAMTFRSPRTLTHFFHRHLLDACHVPDLVLFSRDSAVQMTGIVPALLELRAPWGRFGYFYILFFKMIKIRIRACKVLVQYLHSWRGSDQHQTCSVTSEVREKLSSLDLWRALCFWKGGALDRIRTSHVSTEYIFPDWVSFAWGLKPSWCYDSYVSFSICLT